MNKHSLTVWLKIYISIFGKFFSYVIPPIISAIIYIIIYHIFTPNFGLLLLLLICLTIPIVYLYIKIHELFVAYLSTTEIIIETLKKDMEKHSEGLSERPGKIFPDKPMVNLKNYINAITSIKTRGYIEFNNCQNMGLNFKNKKSLMLHDETPGMSKYFMILTSDDDTSANGYIRIYVPDRLDVDTRDFTETWFNHIFPILGNLSDSVSEKLAGDIIGYPCAGFYIIRNFKINKRDNKGKVSVRIYM